MQSNFKSQSQTAGQKGQAWAGDNDIERALTQEYCKVGILFWRQWKCVHSSRILSISKSTWIGEETGSAEWDGSPLLFAITYRCYEANA